MREAKATLVSPRGLAPTAPTGQPEHAPCGEWSVRGPGRWCADGCGPFVEEGVHRDTRLIVDLVGVGLPAAPDGTRCQVEVTTVIAHDRLGLEWVADDVAGGVVEHATHPGGDWRVSLTLIGLEMGAAVHALDHALTGLTVVHDLLVLDRSGRACRLDRERRLVLALGAPVHSSSGDAAAMGGPVEIV